MLTLTIQVQVIALLIRTLATHMRPRSHQSPTAAAGEPVRMSCQEVVELVSGSESSDSVESCAEEPDVDCDRNTHANRS